MFFLITFIACGVFHQTVFVAWLVFLCLTAADSFLYSHPFDASRVVSPDHITDFSPDPNSFHIPHPVLNWYSKFHIGYPSTSFVQSCKGAQKVWLRMKCMDKSTMYCLLYCFFDDYGHASVTAVGLVHQGYDMTS